MRGKGADARVVAVFFPEKALMESCVGGGDSPEGFPKDGVVELIHRASLA